VTGELGTGDISSEHALHSAVPGTAASLLKSAGIAPEPGSAPGVDGPVCPTLNYPWKKACGGPKMSNFYLFNTTTESGHEQLKNGEGRPAYLSRYYSIHECWECRAGISISAS